MNLAEVFAMLVQLGVCAPVQFNAPDQAVLTVLVCPFAQPAEVAPSEEPAPAAPPLSKKRAVN